MKPLKGVKQLTSIYIFILDSAFLKKCKEGNNGSKTLFKRAL